MVTVSGFLTAGFSIASAPIINGATIGIGGAVTRSPLPHHRARVAQTLDFMSASPLDCKNLNSGHQPRGGKGDVDIIFQSTCPWVGDADMKGNVCATRRPRTAPECSLTFLLTKPRLIGIVNRQACVRRRKGAAHAEPATVRPPLPSGASIPTKCHFRGWAYSKKMLINNDQSQYVYENKRNMDTMTATKSDIYGNMTWILQKRSGYGGQFSLNDQVFSLHEHGPAADLRRRRAFSSLGKRGWPIRVFQNMGPLVGDADMKGNVCD